MTIGRRPDRPGSVSVDSADPVRRDHGGVAGVSVAVWIVAAVEGWRGRLAQRSAARAVTRSLHPLYRLVADGDSTVFHVRRYLRLHRRDPMTALAHQVSAITEYREKLAGFGDPAVDELADQWGRALAEAIVLTAAADAQRRGKPGPARTRAQSVDDRRWDSPDGQLLLASVLSMLRSAGVELAGKPWPTQEIGKMVAGMGSGP